MLLVTISLHIIVHQSKSKENFLICPSSYKAKGQSWYAATPNNIPVDSLKPSTVNLTDALTNQTGQYKPRLFSVCVLCTLPPNHEVELCIGQETLRTTNLAYERRSTSTGDNQGTLVWFNATNPVGLIIDLSKEDLLSTLKSVQPVTNSSLQMPDLNCHSSFLFEKLEARSPLNKSDSHLRFCIICFGAQLKFSGCSSYEQNFGSFLIPAFPAIDKNCFKNKKQSDVCQMDVQTLLSGNQWPCGVFKPINFWAYTQDIQAKDLIFDCVNAELQGEYSQN